MGKIRIYLPCQDELKHRNNPPVYPVGDVLAVGYQHAGQQVWNESELGDIEQCAFHRFQFTGTVGK